MTVSGQTTQFIYDGDGNLVKKIKPDGSSTTYGRGIYEVDKNAGGSVTRVLTYYPMGGAMRINSTLYYILKDHLGSASVVTDASGNAVGEQRYYPYGETRVTTGTIYTDQLFTGQREMAGLGIYHYGARFYSPKLGRFLNADTIVPNAANPQDFNRYSYVYNNPINYIDPSGHLPGYFDPIKSVSSVGGGGCGTRGQPSCGGGGTDTNDNGIPDMPDSTVEIPQPSGVCEYDNIIECTYSGGYWPSGDYTFSDEEWAMFEQAIYLDIARRANEGDGFWTNEFDPPGPPSVRTDRLFLPYHTASYYDRQGYDTIFWNGSETDPRYSGNICFESGACYDRTEVNYIAQGMWSAAASEGHVGAFFAANVWNLYKYEHLASLDEIYWSIHGVNAYVLNGPYDVMGK